MLPRILQLEQRVKALEQKTRDAERLHEKLQAESVGIREMLPGLMNKAAEVIAGNIGNSLAPQIAALDRDGSRLNLLLQPMTLDHCVDQLVLLSQEDWTKCASLCKEICRVSHAVSQKKFQCCSHC